uniref:Uncharacterized protein n=1 Tax=Glossina pallidipes TaxID=7398 RepID=A0A1B0ADY9_GLOPL
MSVPKLSQLPKSAKPTMKSLVLPFLITTIVGMTFMRKRCDKNGDFSTLTLQNFALICFPANTKLLLFKLKAKNLPIDYKSETDLKKSITTKEKTQLSKVELIVEVSTSSQSLIGGSLIKVLTTSRFFLTGFTLGITHIVSFKAAILIISKDMHNGVCGANHIN